MVHIMLAPMQHCIDIEEPPAGWLHGILAKQRAIATRGRKNSVTSGISVPALTFEIPS
jgi:hypothetical protein